MRMTKLLIAALIAAAAIVTPLTASTASASNYWCIRSVGPTVSSAKCHGSFASFRVYQYCSDGTWKYGSWRYSGQTSVIYCPGFFSGQMGITYL